MPTLCRRCRGAKSMTAVRINYRLFNIGVYLTAVVALVDQISKWWALHVVFVDTDFVKVTPFLNLKMSWNKGVTFGFLSHYGDWMPYVLMVVTAAILLLLLAWLRRSTRLLTSLGLGFVMGGAIGNVIDRLQYSAVADFLDLHYASYHWYTFNVADSAIVLGVGCLLFENLLDNRKKR